MKILLYYVRTEKHLSLRELSELSGISPSGLNKIENGTRSPTLDTLYLIAKALECKVSDLYEED